MTPIKAMSGIYPQSEQTLVSDYSYAMWTVDETSLVTVSWLL